MSYIEHDLIFVQEYGGYVTDITRSWPVDAEFTTPQRDMYEMILQVQRSCIALCRESSNMSLDQLHQIADNGLKDGLTRLGFDLSNNVRVLKTSTLPLLMTSGYGELVSSPCWPLPRLSCT